ncbi:MAG: Ni/Fe hydrogenase subunit alpha [Thermoproteota archaeon]
MREATKRREQQSDIVKVHYISRVEGQGSINIKVTSSGNATARFEVFEPIRLFEAFLVGRKYNEVHELTSRICGICPIAHQITALRAVENALRVTVTPQTRALRRLLALSGWIQSHTLSLYFLTAPDYIGFDSAISMTSKYEDAVKQALRLKKIGNDLGEIVGGRAIHPISAVVGGFTKTPTKDELAKIRQRLKKEKDEIWSTVELFSRFDYPEIDRKTELVAISSDEEYAVNEGRLKSSSGIDSPEQDYRIHVQEKEVGYSNTKSSLIKGQDFLVGPIARVSLNHQKLTPDAKKAAKKLGLDLPCYDPFANIKARVVEVVYALDEAIRIIDALKLDISEQPIQAEIGTPCEGAALTEAPRGLLYHWYRLDHLGVVKKADIVPPTAHNSTSIEASLCALVPKLIQKGEDLTLRCEMLVRAYDPCISCSVHVLRVE